MSNFTGKTVYLGLDVHKETFSLTAIVDHEVVKQDRIQANPMALLKYCTKYFPGAEIKSAYEAGFCGFYLHRFLSSHGINNIVVHPASIEVSSRDRVKTDKRDSRKIAVQLEAERLKGIYIPTQKREQFRALTRLRETFVRYKHRLCCQLKSLLMQQDWAWPCVFPDISEKWIKNLLKTAEKLKLTGKFEIGYTIESLSKAWLEFNQKVKDIETQMKLQAEEDPLEVTYRSVPGIGPVSARILANELNDMSQFENEKKLFSFTGLTPCEYSSGEHKRQGHISRQGKSIIRKILVQAAWRAIRIDPSLGDCFARISKVAGPKRAIVAVARRMVGRMRSCFRKGVLYSVETLEAEAGNS